MFNEASGYQTNKRCIEIWFITSKATFMPCATKGQNILLKQNYHISSSHHMIKHTRRNHTHGISYHDFKQSVFTAEHASKAMPLSSTLSSLVGALLNFTNKKPNDILNTPLSHAKWTFVIVSPTISCQSRPPNPPPNMMMNISGVISV